MCGSMRRLACSRGSTCGCGSSRTAAGLRRSPATSWNTVRCTGRVWDATGARRRCRACCASTARCTRRTSPCEAAGGALTRRARTFFEQGVGELRPARPPRWCPCRSVPTRAAPVARDWGFSRGTPVDCYYINAFLQLCAADVRGVVLDVQEPDNARNRRRLRIAGVDVIDVDGRNSRATVVADLRCAPNVAAASYDCIAPTQTLHLVDDMPRWSCARMLRTGGVLLVTMPCASRIANDYGPAHDHWRVTAPAARRLFAEQFGPHVRVESWGNAATTAVFLQWVWRYTSSHRRRSHRDHPTIRCCYGARGEAVIRCYSAGRHSRRVR